MTKKKYYFGNYPERGDYFDNIPVGLNKWDAQEVLQEPDEDIPDEEDENDTDK